MPTKITPTARCLFSSRIARPPLLRSTAGHGHEAPHRPRLFPELVALGLEGDRLADGGRQFFIADALAQQGAQFELVVLAQAKVQGAVRRQAHAVAGGAEVPGHGSDETDVQSGAGDPDILRRPPARHYAGYKV